MRYALLGWSARLRGADLDRCCLLDSLEDFRQKPLSTLAPFDPTFCTTWICSSRERAHQADNRASYRLVLADTVDTPFVSDETKNVELEHPRVTDRLNKRE